MMCLARQEITPTDAAAHWHLPSAGGPSTLARQPSNPADIHASDSAPSSRDPLHVVRGTGPACAGGRRPETVSQRRRKRGWRAHSSRRYRTAELAGTRQDLRRAAVQPAAAGQRRERREAWPGLVVRNRHPAWAAGHADRRGRHDVYDRRLERRLRARREDRGGTLDVRPTGSARVGTLRLLRRREPRRGHLEGCRLLCHARRPAHLARCAHRRQALGGQHHRPHQALHDHRCAAHRQRQGADRQRRR